MRSEVNSRGNNVLHWIFFQYLIIRYPVLAIAMSWVSVTAVEKVKSLGKTIIAIMGNPNPIFA